MNRLEVAFSSDAQYLKWASANNAALQTVAATGCPRCFSTKVELRHDKTYKVVRLHCFECRYETSYRIKNPNPGSYEIIPVVENGVQVDERIVDSYHPATSRQRSDAVVLRVSRSVDSGRLSLGGEWHVDKAIGGVHGQKRYYTSFEEAMQLCSWNRMQLDHQRRLRELEASSAV